MSWRYNIDDYEGAVYAFNAIGTMRAVTILRLTQDS